MKKFKLLLAALSMVGIANSAFADDNTLVAYFSYGENARLSADVDASASASIQFWDNKMTGNTGVVARFISNATDSDLFSILTDEKYPSTYDDTLTVGRRERSENFRPKLVSHIENFDKYDTIFLGFPNWWGDMPMALYSFLDEYDFSGKTIVPFVTSGGSGFSNTINSIKSAEPNATVLNGFSIGGRRAVNAENEVLRELRKLNFID